MFSCCAAIFSQRVCVGWRPSFLWSRWPPSVASRPALLLLTSLSPSFEADAALPRETHHLHLANAIYILSIWDFGVSQPERIMGSMASTI